MEDASRGKWNRSLKAAVPAQAVSCAGPLTQVPPAASAGPARSHPLRAALLGLLLLLTLPMVCAGAAAVGEYQVKAVFLFNFTRFIQWPADAFPDPGAPFVIGVLGHDPFGNALDEAIRGEMAQGRPLVVQRFANVAELMPCQILFIDRSAREDAGKVLDALAHKGTLTVSDTDADMAREVIIGFRNEDHKIRLRINVDSARSAGLTISSKLLRPAQVIGRIGSG